MEKHLIARSLLRQHNITQVTKKTTPINVGTQPTHTQYPLCKQSRKIGPTPPKYSNNQENNNQFEFGNGNTNQENKNWNSKLIVDMRPTNTILEKYID